MGGLYRGFSISAVGIFIYCGMYFGLYDTLKPLLLGDDAGVTVSFLLGWFVTVTAGLMSYPIDTVRRRMMMTSGGGAKYKGSIDCFTQVLKNEGFMSLMKGAGANILRGVAGAGVLAGFDLVFEGKVEGLGGEVPQNIGKVSSPEGVDSLSLENSHGTVNHTIIRLVQPALLDHFILV